jgi:hypothetical protein
LRAWTGATIISPAAILFTTSGSRAYGGIRILNLWDGMR